jgi:hypothetical protein
MNRGTLFLGASIVAAACYACTGGDPGLNRDKSDKRDVACPALDNMTMLNPAYVNLADASVIPTSDPRHPNVQGNVKNDVKAAIQMAPAFFQRQVCALTGLFIAPSGDSWGLRNTSDQSKKYLALSMELWPGGGSGGAKKFANHEDDVVQRLLRWTGPKHAPGSNNPANISAVTVLSVLAHEYGHILFYDTFVKTSKAAPDFTLFCGNLFYSQSWQTLPNSPILWRNFGDSAGDHKSDDVQIADIVNAAPPVGQADTLGAGALFDRLYNLNNATGASGRWASAFSAWSPDEDFVETFRLFVLKNSQTPLQTLPIQIPIQATVNGSPLTVTVTEDIPGTCTMRPVLSAKLFCFVQAMCNTIADPCSPVQNCP